MKELYIMGKDIVPHPIGALNPDRKIRKKNKINGWLSRMKAKNKSMLYNAISFLFIFVLKLGIEMKRKMFWSRRPWRG